jgi:hypothetical protein
MSTASLTTQGREKVNMVMGLRTKNNCAGEGRWHFIWNQKLRPMNMFMTSQKTLQVGLFITSALDTGKWLAPLPPALPTRKDEHLVYPLNVACFTKLTLLDFTNLITNNRNSQYLISSSLLLVTCLTSNYSSQQPISRSQWTRGLRHELPSPAPTLRSWVRIPLRHGCLCVFCVRFFCFYIVSNETASLIKG